MPVLLGINFPQNMPQHAQYHRRIARVQLQPPHQATRIEPYEDPNLSGEAKEIYNDLLRYSVFLEDVRGTTERRPHMCTGA